MVRPSTLLALGALAAAAVACAPADNTASTTGTAGPAPSTACGKDQLKLVNAGKLTIGTDKPAFEPWFKDDDPANGQGFESAVAFAVAGELGFDRDEVQWTTVKFDSAFAPGPKQFDFDVNQVSITPKRAEAVDFSNGYYAVKQAVVAIDGSKFAGAKSLAELKDAKIGVQVGTTSLAAVKEVIKPAAEPNVYNDQIDAVNALENKQVDAIVVDLPHRVLRDRRPGREVQDRRPVQRDGRRAGGVRAGHAEGQPAEVLRGQGRGRAEVQGRAGQDRAAVARLGGRRARARLADGR